MGIDEGLLLETDELDIRPTVTRELSVPQLLLGVLSLDGDVVGEYGHQQLARSEEVIRKGNRIRSPETAEDLLCLFVETHRVLVGLERGEAELLLRGDVDGGVVVRLPAVGIHTVAAGVEELLVDGHVLREELVNPGDLEMLPVYRIGYFLLWCSAFRRRPPPSYRGG